MVDLLEADDLLLVQDLYRVEPQVPSALSYAPKCQSLDDQNAIRNHDVTEMNASKATRAEGSMDDEVLNGVGGFGPSLKY